MPDIPLPDSFEQRYGRFGGRELRRLPLTSDQTADSGAGNDQFTVRGHAAVFDSWSLDLGGFREKIARGAFDRVLGNSPNVMLLWDHDTRNVLASTRNKTLELRIDPYGLHYWARIAPTSYAADLRVLMDRGDIQEASFAFTVAKDEWTVRTDDNGDEIVERTIVEVAELFDCTVCAMGAYPAADSQVVRARALDYANENGRLPDGAGAETVAPMAGGDESHHEVGSQHMEQLLRVARARARRRL